MTTNTPPPKKLFFLEKIIQTISKKIYYYLFIFCVFSFAKINRNLLISLEKSEAFSILSISIENIFLKNIQFHRVPDNQIDCTFLIYRTSLLILS